MLLTVTTTRAPASELGYLLHKHPGKLQSFEVSVGSAHVFYPEATEARCTAALLLEVDPIALVRGRKGPASEGFALGQYVNDRPYAASSMLAVALARVFKTAMAGRCDARPELAAAALPLELHVPAMPCRGGPELARRFFEPLGWQVTATSIPLDPRFPDWGDSRYVDLHLRGTMKLSEALNHLYVLLPVLDDAKHYWVSPDEVDKLVRAGEGWLSSHPERDLITRRYLSHRRALFHTAIARLAEVDDVDPDQLDNAIEDLIVDATDTGDEPSKPVPLVQQRHEAVLAALHSAGARRVADVGCGAGALLTLLLADPAFTHVIGADVSARALQTAARRLNIDRMPDHQRERLTLIQSSLTYRDARLSGLDAVVLMEVIEHLDLPRLPALERTLFGDAGPQTVVVTTPNVEHNVRYKDLPAGSMRHRDHRFEWTRAEFGDWSKRVARSYGYAVRIEAVGVDDAEVGAPTQLAIFTKISAATASTEAAA
ncbi:MAG: 3 terminal ribose 2-O-methyltransferase Hen1 [Mycobacterium sp.]|nr:3 terminal ribose 2-O-methyltransferase Hen1 [Mycobacterium sp.]